MLLAELPNDILSSLPSYLHSSQDLLSVILTCRALNAICSHPTPTQLVGLANTELGPQQHLLVAVKVGKLSDWVVDKAHPERRAVLRHAILGGPETLLKQALMVSPLTLADCLKAAWAKKAVLDPVVRMLIAERDGILPPGQPTSSKIEAALLTVSNYWVFCNLFHHSILPPHIFTTDIAQAIEPLDRSFRFDWFRHCISGDTNIHIVRRENLQRSDLHPLVHTLFKMLHMKLSNHDEGLGAPCTKKQPFFYETGSQLGLLSLRILLPNACERLPKEIERIKDTIKQLKYSK